MKRAQQQTIPHASQAIIHLDRLEQNVHTIRGRMPGIELIGVVKANAYGHGSTRVSSKLHNLGVRTLSVATVSEAVHLREHGISSEIIVFAPPTSESIYAFAEYDLQPIVDCPETLSIVEQTVKAMDVHLKVDTGMGRLGVTTQDAIRLIRRIETRSGVNLSSIWTHFARADEPENEMTRLQFDRFTHLIDQLGSPPAPLHVAASAAVFSFPESVDPTIMSMARVGIALYGLLDLPNERPPAGLSPVMEFVSRVSAVKTVPPNTPISYGSRWRAPSTRRIATVAAGYADGVPRVLSNKGQVRIENSLFPIAGTVCMDMFMVDLGEPSETNANIGVGTPVQIFGAKSPTCFEIADQAQTITYVPICGISDRVQRKSCP
ncbi:MAG: alanine racemase [Rhodothermales bacterium]|nr:alanine racemase [Rhodothermales bacterium]MDG2016192.1 alanine racemase [Rhodothermales bacterium]